MSCILYKSYLKTEIGVLTIICCQQGAHAIQISELDSLESTLLDLNNDVDKSGVSKQVITWLESYFKCAAHTNSKPMPPICSSLFSSNGSFRAKVWQTLASEVPPGKTISYINLAAMSGSVSASRAVGSAMRTNPLPILIPCHRVVRSDGTVGHYTGGAHIKEWLLNHENSLLN